MTVKKGTALAAALLGATVLGSAPAFAFGEAGPLNLEQYGYFLVNTKVVDNAPNAQGVVTRGVTEQMFVEFMIPQEQTHPYPVVLIHGGGGQGTDWMATVDGRDGWVNYLVNAGFAVYWVDRPGAGRSASNNTYGNGMLNTPGAPNGIIGLAFSENWPNAPMIYNSDGTPNEEAWAAANAENPTIVAWSATSPRVPFASNQVAGEAIAALLDRIGPAILFTHSAGGTSTGIAATIAAQSGNVKGILAFESGGADPYAGGIVNGSQWSGTAPGNDARANVMVEGANCSLQTAPEKSRNLTLAGVRYAYLGSEHNSSMATAVCRAMQAEEVGLDAISVFMGEVPAGDGSGHFAMSETINGDIATDILVPMLSWLSGEEMPADLMHH